MERKMTSTTGRPTRARAFTLVELILVMVIIATVLGITAPSLRGFFASHQTRDAAGRIVALAQYARTQAVAEGRAYRLNFDTSAGTYWLTAQEGAEFTALRSEFGRTFTLPDGTTFDMTGTGEREMPRQMEFTPGGSAPAARLRLLGRQDERVEIYCPAPTESFAVATATEEGGK